LVFFLGAASEKKSAPTEMATLCLKRNAAGLFDN
jgi:hypothetical protein